MPDDRWDSLARMVTIETLAAILTRVESKLDKLDDDVSKLDADVRINFVRRDELNRYVTLDRYVWIERIVIGMASLAGLAVGGAILASVLTVSK